MSNKLLSIVGIMLLFCMVDVQAKEASTEVDLLLDELTSESIKESLDDGKELEPSLLVKMSQAKIVILNKITAKSKQVTFNLGQAQSFGNLYIEVHKCIRNTDPFNINNFMLLTVVDNKMDADKIPIFHGWVVSSNPSLSTLEHPVYEVIPVDCISNAGGNK